MTVSPRNGLNKGQNLNNHQTNKKIILVLNET